LVEQDFSLASEVFVSMKIEPQPRKRLQDYSLTFGQVTGNWSQTKIT